MLRERESDTYGRKGNYRLHFIYTLTPAHIETHIVNWIGGYVKVGILSHI